MREIRQIMFDLYWKGLPNGRYAKNEGVKQYILERKMIK